MTITKTQNNSGSTDYSNSPILFRTHSTPNQGHVFKTSVYDSVFSERITDPFGVRCRIWNSSQKRSKYKALFPHMRPRQRMVLSLTSRWQFSTIPRIKQRTLCLNVRSTISSRCVIRLNFALLNFLSPFLCSIRIIIRHAHDILLTDTTMFHDLRMMCIFKLDYWLGSNTY